MKLIPLQLFPHVAYLNNHGTTSTQLEEGAREEADSDTDESEWGSSVATSDLDSTTDSDCDWHDFDDIPTYLPVLSRFMAWS